MPTTVLNCTADTHLIELSGSPGGSSGTIVLGYEPSLGYRNGLFKFNLSTISGTVTSAVFGLYLQVAAASSGRYAEILCVDPSVPWVEAEADWDEYATSQLWGSVGGDIDYGGQSAGEWEIPTSGAGGPISIDVTNLVQDYKDRALSVITIFVWSQYQSTSPPNAVCTVGAKDNFFSGRRPILTVTTSAPHNQTMTGGFREMNGGWRG